MMDASPEITELAKALVAAQSEFESVAKTAENPFFKSKYADLPAVVAAAAPILAKHGLAVVQSLGFFEDTDTLTTRLLHESGQWIEDICKLHLVKQDPQAHGSAVTYARRYSYMAILGLVADVDDDGNSASVAAQPERAKATTTKRAAPVVVTAPKDEIPAASGALRSLFAIKDRSGDPLVPKEDAERHAWAGRILNRTVGSFTELTGEDISLLKKEAKRQAIDSQPPTEYKPGEEPF